MEFQINIPHIFRKEKKLLILKKAGMIQRL